MEIGCEKEIKKLETDINDSGYRNNQILASSSFIGSSYVFLSPFFQIR